MMQVCTSKYQICNNRNIYKAQNNLEEGVIESEGEKLLPK